MASAGWSSLPDDLVRRIADSFLATNDVDCYMGLRAVCASWRAATDDPKTNTADPRFCPQTWIVLDEVFQGTLFLFKISNETGKPEALQDISNFAMFIGHQRCLSVDANKFPGIEANCVYCTEHLGSWAHICKCNIKDKKVERISEAPEFVKQDKQFVLVADRPFTIIQLLCSYTINISDSQLALQQMSQGAKESCSNSEGIDLND